MGASGSDVAAALARLPRHKYRAVLADPPWTFRSWSPAGEGRSAQRHYRCLTASELAALPLRRVCDVDCWLFLWATGPCLPHAIAAIDYWGFTYSGLAFCWAKQSRSGRRWHVGLGHTTRKNVEFCLLGRRGKPARNAADVRELIVAPLREHSRKPEETYERIEAFCDGPYLELFARHSREGWTSLGAERKRFSGG